MKKNKEGTQVAKHKDKKSFKARLSSCLLYISPSPRDYAATRMPSSA